MELLSKEQPLPALAINSWILNKNKEMETSQIDE